MENSKENIDYLIESIRLIENVIAKKIKAESATMSDYVINGIIQQTWDGIKMRISKDDEIDVLVLKFKELDSYYLGCKFFRTESQFYPIEYNEEMKAIFFSCSGKDDADSLEYYIEQELQNFDISGFYFESECSSKLTF